MTNQIWRKLYDDAFIGMDGNTPTKLLHEAFKSNDIEEQGTHESLLQQQGLYARLAQGFKW